MVDTSLFPPRFQAALLSQLSDTHDIDATTDGVLIHSDNFQALNLLLARYREQVKCIYIDPPYNTGNDGFIYKDGYGHSSWLTLMESRLQAAYPLLRQDGVNFISIDDNEQAKLKQLCDGVYGEGNFAAIFPWRKRTAKSDVPFGVSQDYEYIFIYARSTNFVASIEGKERKYFTSPDFPNRPWRIHDCTTQRSKEERPNSFFTMIDPKTGKEYPANPNATWRVTKDTFQDYYNKGKIVFPDDYDFLNISRPVMRYFKDDDMKKAGENFGRIAVSTRLPETVGMSLNGTKDIQNLFTDKLFSFPKPEALVYFLYQILANSNSCILDYFAGSGTTAHAVINLNREDGGKRKYILVEQGEYFDTVLKPRVQKVVFAENWKDGKPQADAEKGYNGVPQIVKVFRLESYEDALNNLELKRQNDLFGLPEAAREDYLLRYMLDVESKNSLLKTDDFKKPFDYRLNLATDSAGAYEAVNIDLVETFNYLIGLHMSRITDEREKRGFVLVEGSLPSGESCLVVWRDCERVDYEAADKMLSKMGINPRSTQYDVIYINGDHNIATVWQSDDGSDTQMLKLRPIEPEFLRLMFGEDA